MVQLVSVVQLGRARTSRPTKWGDLVVTRTNDEQGDDTTPAGNVVPFCRREVEVVLPDACPELGPSAAAALLTLLLNARERAVGERAA